VALSHLGFLVLESANGSSIGLADGSHRGTWTVTTVPEPMSLLLVAAGIGGVVLARGRRARIRR